MQLVNHVHGWENFAYAKQDNKGLIVTGAGGLWTLGLANCLCVIVAGPGGKYGMIHIKPEHDKQVKWVRSLIRNTQANEAVITGGNSPVQDPLRVAQTWAMFSESPISIVDETRNGWLAAAALQLPEPNPHIVVVRGANRSYGGVAAVSAQTGEYAIVHHGLQSSAAMRPPHAAAQRGSGDGDCVMM